MEVSDHAFMCISFADVFVVRDTNLIERYVGYGFVNIFGCIEDEAIDESIMNLVTFFVGTDFYCTISCLYVIIYKYCDCRCDTTVINFTSYGAFFDKICVNWKLRGIDRTSVDHNNRLYLRKISILINFSFLCI